MSFARTTAARPALRLLPTLLCASLISLGNTAQAQTDTATEAAGTAHKPFATEQEKISYATGVQTARNLTRNDISFDLDVLVQGLRDVLGNQPLRMSEKDLRTALQKVQGDVHRNTVANRQALMNKNRVRGESFQAEFRQKPDVKVTTGNVLYRVLRQGSGPLPGDSDMIVVRYRGMLVDGTEFDASTSEKGVPMKVEQMVQGWRQAIKQMPVGSHWEIVVPANLAYGDRGVGTVIGPAETLVYNVELLDIKAQQ
jgi:FKBP-type peptidyl-prolyl cis-trans isomerase FklB